MLCELQKVEMPGARFFLHTIEAAELGRLQDSMPSKY